MVNSMTDNEFANAVTIRLIKHDKQHFIWFQFY